MKLLTSVCLIMIAHCFLYSDDIHMKDGRVLKGKAIYHEKKIELKMTMGSIFIDKDDVAKVVSKQSPSEEFTERYQQINDDDFAALQELAQWCQQNYPFKLREITEKALRAELKHRLAQAGSHPDHLYQVVLWAKTNKFPKKTVVNTLKRIIGVAPEHAGARKDLGEVKYQGNWMSQEQAKELEKRDFDAKMREIGLVDYKGNWVRPEEAKWLDELEELRKQNRDLHKKQQETEKQVEEFKKDYERLQSAEKLQQKEIDDLRKDLRFLEVFRDTARRSSLELQRDIRTLEATLARPPVLVDRSIIPFLQTLRIIARRIKSSADDLSNQVK